MLASMPLPTFLPSFPFQMDLVQDDAASTTASQASQDGPETPNQKTMTTTVVRDKKAHMIRSQFFKTQLCRYHTKGYCRNGDQCAFAHGGKNVAPPPDLTKTSLCAQWVKGECPLGADKCGFAHGHEELRVTQTFKKTSMCSMFLRGGFCPQGDKCRHAHSIGEVKPCKGNKTWGDDLRNGFEAVSLGFDAGDMDNVKNGHRGPPERDEPYRIPLLEGLAQYEPFEFPTDKDEPDPQLGRQTVYPVKDANGVCWLAVYSL